MTAIASPTLPRRSEIGRREADAELFRRYARNGDSRAREELVERFMPLAAQLTRRYSGAHDADDLMQVAALGLLKAIDRFDAERGTSFSSFAVPTILGELKRHFRDFGWTLHVPRTLQELTLRVRTATDTLTRDNGRAPTPLEIARALDEPVENVVEALATASAHHTVSLDAPPAIAGGEPDAAAWHERLGAEDDGYDRVEWRGTLARGVRALPERDRCILALRFDAGLTQAEIAEQIGVSQMHVSRLLRRALDRLRAVAVAAA